MVGLGAGAAWLVTGAPLGISGPMSPAGGSGLAPPSSFDAQTATEDEAKWRACIDQLMRSEKPKVVATLRRQRILADVDVEDAVVDSILKVCAANARAGYANLGAVLQQASRRTALDWRRRRSRECPVEAAPVQCTAREDDARWSDERAIVDAALCAEKPATRESLRRWSEGERDAEIGQALGMAARDVKDARNNAIKRIRKKLDATCGQKKH